MSEDITTWPTKEQVAKRLNRSVAAVSRLTKKGLLNPERDEEGCNRYPPDEVDAVVESGAAKSSGDAKQEVEEISLSVVRDMIHLIRAPRDKIDQIQFEIIDRLQKRVIYLEDERAKWFAEIEQARDNSADRATAMSMVLSETRVKELALGRVIETISRVLGGSAGVTFSPDQLQELILAGGFLTPEQEVQAKKIVTAAKQKTGDAPMAKEDVTGVVDSLKTVIAGGTPAP